ncbi:BANK1 protein, partial [Amia calva]|nr:BANK1 protein [Amia calva]
MLDGLCQIRKFFLARVLQPSNTVVILLCGVDGLGPFPEMVPIGNDYVQIYSEQDPQIYLSTVSQIVQRGSQIAFEVSALSARTARMELKAEKRLSTESLPGKLSVLVIPTRIPCEKPGEIFILLQDAVNPKDIEIEFQADKQKVKVKPSSWNEQTLSVKAVDFPPGTVDVIVYCRGSIGAKTQIQYYTSMEEIALLLKKEADPMKFMCQAFQISSTEQLDQLLTSSLREAMPTGGFGVLQLDESNKGSKHSEDLPTLLHFAAKNGLKNVASLLLQCPGAHQAIRMTNKHGEDPLMLAEKHGHKEFHKLLEETLVCNISMEISCCERMDQICALLAVQAAQAAQQVPPPHTMTLHRQLTPHCWSLRGVCLLHLRSRAVDMPPGRRTACLWVRLRQSSWRRSWSHPDRMRDSSADSPICRPDRPSPWRALAAPSGSGFVFPGAGQTLAPQSGPPPALGLAPEQEQLIAWEIETHQTRQHFSSLQLSNFGEESEDDSIYERMKTAAPDNYENQSEEGREELDEEDPYSLGGNDEEYDMILTSNKAMSIINRPPAPTPRPETSPVKEESTPFIAQVFQKKMSMGDTGTLYSAPSRQAKGRDSISSTYDSFVPCQPTGLEELIELQEKVKSGSLTMDEALERFSDWQKDQKGLDTIQQVMFLRV